MKFTVNLIALLFGALSSTMVAQAVPTVVRPTPLKQDPDEMSITFYEYTSFRGTSYSPIYSGPDFCIDLPLGRQNRPESLEISSGYSCAFYAFIECIGPEQSFSGDVANLPRIGVPPRYRRIASFECTKLG
ncbi:hypothetical protein JR316_0009366 [Psilocybe cubensis]|uniref:Uncharacterized protein n=2 Tax=Psilocybe cubensis TaxID=181762 RepID=A0A8H7XZL4_PSICU|nr:hypothetical protein JR316_0009366 [Psilocybe cubensis]KAH9478904.1 hypothetical protein JR316_0009366 [Psilocybe cubensis]